MKAFAFSKWIRTYQLIFLNYLQTLFWLRSITFQIEKKYFRMMIKTLCRNITQYNNNNKGSPANFGKSKRKCFHPLINNQTQIISFAVWLSRSLKKQTGPFLGLITKIGWNLTVLVLFLTLGPVFWTQLRNKKCFNIFCLYLSLKLIDNEQDMSRDLRFCK